MLKDFIKMTLENKIVFVFIVSLLLYAGIKSIFSKDLFGVLLCFCILVIVFCPYEKL
jgi:Flp pilus assembly protein protease CpaA